MRGAAWSPSRPFGWGREEAARSKTGPEAGEQTRLPLGATRPGGGGEGRGRVMGAQEKARIGGKAVNPKEPPAARAGKDPKYRVNKTKSGPRRPKPPVRSCIRVLKRVKCPCPSATRLQVSTSDQSLSARSRCTPADGKRLLGKKHSRDLRGALSRGPREVDAEGRAPQSQPSAPCNHTRILRHRCFRHSSSTPCLSPMCQVAVGIKIRWEGHPALLCEPIRGSGGVVLKG